jgi:hypothetical protein
MVNVEKWKSGTVGKVGKVGKVEKWNSGKVEKEVY